MKYALRDKKEMKHSDIEWVGSIPIGWNSIRLNSLFQHNKKRNDLLEEENLLSLSYGKIIRKNIDANEGLLPESFSTYQIVQPGNIVLRLTDLQNDKRSLRVGYVNERGIITSAYIGLDIIASDQHEGKYFYYLFHAYDLMKVFYNCGAGVRQSLTFNEFKKLNIIAPTKVEQKHIVDFLDEKTAVIDEVMKKKKKQIELLKEKRAGMITQAVTKGLNPNETMVNADVDWIDSISQNHKVLPLKRLVAIKITDGPHTTPQILDEGIPFLSAQSVQDDGYLDFDQKRGFISEVDHKMFSKKCRPMKGDIFIVKSGATTGRVAMVNTDIEFSIWSPLALVRAKTELINPEYLYFFFRSDIFQNQVRVSWSYGTQENIGMNVLERLQIFFPSIKEQAAIIDYLGEKILQIDTLIQKIIESISLIQEYRSSLISHAVTGKVSVETS